MLWATPSKWKGSALALMLASHNGRKLGADRRDLTLLQEGDLRGAP